MPLRFRQQSPFISCCQPLPTAQPTMSRPLAATQLSMTPAAMRVQGRRSRTTRAAARATKTNTAKTGPRRATAPTPGYPIPAPFR